MEKSKKKSMNPFLWIVFAIIIPLIIVSTLTVFILNMAGVDVTGWFKNTASNIPVVSNFITTEEEQAVEDEIKKLTEMIEEKDLEIARLQTISEDLEMTISRLNQQILKLENEIASRDELAEQEEELEVENNESLKQIVSSYESMKTKHAAIIIQNLENDLAIDILKELPNDRRGKILEAMDPERVAELTKLFVN